MLYCNKGNIEILTNMKKTLTILAAALLLAGAATSCASLDKMAEMAEKVKVTCNPEILEAVGGNVDAVVTVTYPADYFNPKAILEVTPVIVYDGGEASAKKLIYQGEKVKDNYRVVSSDGQTVNANIHFEYAEGMEKCHLELRGVAKGKGKSVKLPVKKVADGCNTTYMLAKGDGAVNYKSDQYQSVVTTKVEGQIKYEVGKSDVRKSELSSQSIKDFKAMLEEAAKDERQKISGTEIVSYASPEGSEDLNNKLSADRSASAGKAWGEITGGTSVSDPTLKSVGEDWEGFQKLVAESDIQDKDLILRVLSMYSDPAVRESEIRNMSEVFTSLKGEVLPELRRARLIANIEYQNYTEEELMKLIDENVDVLDEEALLKAASIATDNKKKETLYKKAVTKYDSERAAYNLSALYVDEGKLSQAEKALSKLDQKDPEVLNALGVLALRKGENEKATEYFDKAGNKENLGTVNILEGRYDEALKQLDGTGTFNEALACVLTDNLDKASSILNKIDTPEGNYLKAIIAARQGKESAMKKALKAACEDDALKARAKNDIEFADYDL